MSTYREAILHARRGGTAYCAGKEIRFLTFEEAEPILLEQCPSRRTVIDEKTGKPLVKKKQIVVETYADPNFDTKRLGLYNVGVHPAEQFVPAEEDIAGDWAIEGAQPAVVDPETVDAALAETVVPE